MEKDILKTLLIPGKCFYIELNWYRFGHSFFKANVMDLVLNMTRNARRLGWPGFVFTLALGDIPLMCPSLGLSQGRPSCCGKLTILSH